MKIKRKINKKELILISASIAVMVFSLFIIIYCLTFLIKNINLVFKTPLSSNDEVHFNLAGAEKVFPDISQ